MTRHTPSPDFPIVQAQDSLTIQLPERLTVLEAVNFKEFCYQLLQQQPLPQQIIFDFAQTCFIDSSGIGALVHNTKAIDTKQVSLLICNLQPPVMAVLSMTSLDRVLPIQVASAETTKNLAATETQATKTQPPKTHPSIHSPIKRSIDIVGALVGLGITALIFIPVAIAIKIDSPGPIFFRQTRCGWLGQRFYIWKFRSMCINAEEIKANIQNQANGAFFKNKNDPRVTRVGRFLRRTSLDEFPQFWNVLLGQMSLVGTRPPTPDEVERYQIAQWQRLNVKPGITGEWQVNGRSHIRNFEDVIELDLRYQENWSLFYDLQLIFKTIWVLFHRNNGAV
jgi:exopolysaccharide biosynthesis polyprenyl glycosylphosphotransferase